MLALACPELEIIGLTTIFGNVQVEQSTENALRLLDLAGRPDIPVAQGADRSWADPYAGAKAAVHGKDGQGNTFRPPCSLEPHKRPAADFIAEQVLQYPGEITLIALGPLTNMADALKLKAEIQEQIKGIIFMGGNAFRPGNTSPAAEANIHSDPEAADYVMSLKCPITMVGLDVTEKTYLSARDIEELAANPSAIGKQVFGAYQHYLEFYLNVNKMAGTWVHDSSVITYLLQPDLYDTVSHPIRVETANSISKGKTWPSVKNYGLIREQDNPWKGRPAVTICIDVDGSRAVNLLKERLLNARFPI